MKVFISSDIEGTCGINHWEETHHGHKDVGYFEKMMTREVAAACEGAHAAGAEDVLVKDAHGTARNIIQEDLPEFVRLHRGWTGHPFQMMSGLELEEFDAVMFTGYHSAAGNGNNPLSHTKNTQNEWIKLNGEPLSEFRMNAMMAGYKGIPVCFISGDEGICEEAKKFIPGIRTVAAFKGVGGTTIAPHPNKVQRAIREEVEKALSGDYKACKVPMPEEYDVLIRYRDHAKAYQKSFYPGAELYDDKTVRFYTKDFMEFLTFANMFAF